MFLEASEDHYLMVDIEDGRVKKLDGATWLPASPPTISPLTGQAERSAVARDILSEYGRELIEEYPDTFFNQIFYGILFYEVDNTRYED